MRGKKEEEERETLAMASWMYKQELCIKYFLSVHHVSLLSSHSVMPSIPFPSFPHLNFWFSSFLPRFTKDFQRESGERERKYLDGAFIISSFLSLESESKSVCIWGGERESDWMFWQSELLTQFRGVKVISELGDEVPSLSLSSLDSFPSTDSVLELLAKEREDPSTRCATCSFFPRTARFFYLHAMNRMRISYVKHQNIKRKLFPEGEGKMCRECSLVCSELFWIKRSKINSRDWKGKNQNQKIE